MPSKADKKFVVYIDLKITKVTIIFRNGQFSNKLTLLSFLNLNSNQF